MDNKTMTTVTLRCFGCGAIIQNTGSITLNEKITLIIVLRKL